MFLLVFLTHVEGIALPSEGGGEKKRIHIIKKLPDLHRKGVQEMSAITSVIQVWG